MEMQDFIKHLQISEGLKKQLENNEDAVNNLKKISKYTDINKSIYFDMCMLMKSSYDAYIEEIVDLIEKKKIKNRSMLLKCFEILERKPGNCKDNMLRRHIEESSFDEEKVKSVAGKFDCLKDAMCYINSDDHMAFYDPEKVLSLLKNLNVKSKKIARKGLLNEGKLRFLHKPGENVQITQKIMNDHLARTDGKIITRFPPEPNGYLHIGHAKAMYLDFNFGKQCILRYDDTNPKNEAIEYYGSILEDVNWMGYTPWKITKASDYFDQLISYAKQLIMDGKAYVCHLSTEEIKNQTISPYRERSPAVNLALFEEMIDGKWKEGTAILRLKMDMFSKNMLMHDLIAYRIINADHLSTKKKYFVYPSYDYTHCINDSIEDITHSFCSREFFSRRQSYYWLLDSLKVYKPIQWEFSRLNISNTVLSKRKLNVLVSRGIVTGWDDPRLFTLKGLRRRGVPPEAINAFIEKIGITFNESIIDVRIFESVLRDFLKDKKKIKVLYNPIEMEVQDIEILLIDQDDFKQHKTPDYLRLTSDQPVGLAGKYSVELVSMVNNRLLVKKTEKPVCCRIHWLKKDQTTVKIRIRELSHLFNSFNPEERDFLSDVNPASICIIEGWAESLVTSIEVGEVVQFFRKGWYCRDEDENGVITFNKTVGMKK